MAAPRTHRQRESATLSDLDRCFPSFTGRPVSWDPVPAGNDPPDFIGRAANGSIGLELVEWLDGGQMTDAKHRERYRQQVRDVLKEGWQSRPSPQNFSLAVLSIRWDQRLTPADHAAFRQQFYECAEKVDSTWQTNPKRTGPNYPQLDLSEFPALAKCVKSVLYHGGGPNGQFWVDIRDDGGACDPWLPMRALEKRLDEKIKDYARPQQQARLKGHNLAELTLLVHGGFNIFAYNTPGGPQTARGYASCVHAFCRQHPSRDVFGRVWFFHSVDPASEINGMLGNPPDAGRIRFLAQIWPVLRVDERSVGDAAVFRT